MTETINSQGILEEKLLDTATVIDDLHSSWTPHDGQLKVGKALFYDEKKFIFVQCGRKWGKSELVIYTLYRIALLNPRSTCYYIAPFQKQAKELIWANNRLQNFLKSGIREKYVTHINNTEMRITLINGSFIKLDGADNYEAYRGINPHFVAYDEFKDHHPKFHEGMEPNLVTNNAPCFFIGTPPENETNHFVTMANSVKEDKESGAFFTASSYQNPHINKKWLDKTKERLLARHEKDVWEREYMAMMVKGGKNAIFPMFDTEGMVVPYKQAMEAIKRQLKHYTFTVSADPATSSVFAVLFTAMHKYTKVVTHLDELYISETRETSARKMLARISEKVNEICPDAGNWNYVYDEAAIWFQNEIMDATDGGMNFMPTHKKMHKKENGLSLIKDQMLYNLWKCTDRCEKLQHEILNYVKDVNGNIPKENDHLIDCMRYCNSANHYTHVEESLVVPEKNYMERRAYKISEDMRETTCNEDWSSYILDMDDYYDF